MTQFSIIKQLNSFKYAFRGIRFMLLNEHNVWIHLVFTAAVIAAGFWFSLSKAEWLFLIFAIGLVLVAEAFNTAIEHLANAVSETYNEKIKIAKDVAAGSVLLAAIIAAIIGLLIFIPHLITRLQC